MPSEAPNITELKPCPFCGGTAEFSEKRLKRRTYVTCTSCDTCTRIRDNAQEAAKHWNTRATLPPAGDRLEAIARMIEQAWDKEPAPFNRADVAVRVILASGLVQDEAAIRKDEREKAAVVALEQRCERGTPWDLACTTIAAAIRSASDGGAGL